MDDRKSKELAHFVHDARNDLNIISMGIQSLEELRDRPEEFKEMLEMIREIGVQRLRGRIDGLNDLRKDAGRERAHAAD